MEEPEHTGPTADQTALAEVSAAQHEDYKETSVPLENKYIERSEAKESDRTRAAGEANSKVQAAFSKLDKDQRNSDLSTGVALNSGRAIANMSKNAVSRGRATGKAVTGAKQTVDDTSLSRKVGLTALGKNQASQVIANHSNAAQNSVNNAISAEAARVSNANGLWNAAGSAVGGYAAYRNIAKPKPTPAGNTGFDNSFDSFNGVPNQPLPGL